MNTPLLILMLCLSLQGFGANVHTFYGNLEVEEPVLLALIDSPAMQRLKSIHQYGVAYYTTHTEEYNRFDHSLGVFAVLRIKGACLEEQIAGLLHDVSHTVFSHVGDWVFGREYQENDYQGIIYEQYLTTCGVEEILNRHGYTVEQILPKREAFTMLEQPLPNLSADRIDYNLQGAYFQHFLTREEALELLLDLSFENGNWVCTRTDLASKLTRFSLFMTEDCWGSATNYVTSRWLADAIIQGLNTGLISWREFHFGIDQDIWDKLRASEDFAIKTKMDALMQPNEHFQMVEPAQANLFVRFRCRGIDPWIALHNQNEKIVRLTSIDPEIAASFQKTRKAAAEGWPLKIHPFTQN